MPVQDFEHTWGIYIVWWRRKQRTDQQRFSFAVIRLIVKRTHQKDLVLLWCHNNFLSWWLFSTCICLWYWLSQRLRVSQIFIEMSCSLSWDFWQGRPFWVVVPLQSRQRWFLCCGCQAGECIVQGNVHHPSLSVFWKLSCHFNRRCRLFVS